MFCNADGTPNNTGDYELVDGRPKPRTMRDGEWVRFEVALMDGVPAGRIVTGDAKPDEPKTIDQALRAAFAQMAETKGTTVPELLAALQQREIEDLAASTAKSFMSSLAGAGIAKQFSDSASAASAVATAARDAAHRIQLDSLRESMVADMANRSGGLYRAGPIAGPPPESNSAAPLHATDADVETAFRAMCADYATPKREA